MMLLSTVVLAALSAGTPFLTPGTYAYSASVAGNAVGESSITVARDGTTTKIDEKATGQMAGTSFSGNASLVIGADLAPVEYNGQYLLGGQQSSAAASLTPSSATVISSQAGGEPQTFALNAESHFVVIEPGLMAGLFALPAQMEAWKDAPALAIAPSYDQSRAIAPDTSSPPPPRPSGVPASDATLSFSGAYGFTMWYDPATFVPDAVYVPSQDATITRVTNQ